MIRLDDFPNPADLAAYLKYLMTNVTEYESYFRFVPLCLFVPFVKVRVSIVTTIPPPSFRGQPDVKPLNDAIWGTRGLRTNEDQFCRVCEESFALRMQYKEIGQRQREKRVRREGWWKYPVKTPPVRPVPFQRPPPIPLKRLRTVLDPEWSCWANKWGVMSKIVASAASSSSAHNKSAAD